MENTPDKLWETGEKCVPVPNTSTIEVGSKKEKILLLNNFFFKVSTVICHFKLS